jgi:hypothetical protein
MSGMKDLLGDEAYAPSYPVSVPVDVCNKFLSLALTAKRSGLRRYSSDAILHRIRWFEHVERGNREFKCNDHWTAPLSRWAMQTEPSLEGFFETRIRRSTPDGALL